ncbi:MAG: Fe-S cluster assembly scaffold protein NifU [Candidatus Krumholzibacteriota bacterium]|nr:Fe-S cluster assembly scaffold protein NifU [Candidatus Krumholzibacteriota bacterium]
MALYSEKVMDHFMNPRNVGALENPDGVGEVGNPVCGDMMTFMISVREGRISDIKFKTFGCGAAIAVSSMVSELALGKTLDEAMEITNQMVAEELGGLPANKMHCSNLGADALHRAIEDFRKRQKTGEPAPKPKARQPELGDQACPFCDAVVEADAPHCSTCHMALVHCPACGKIADQSRETCPHCGGPLQAEKEKE